MYSLMNAWSVQSIVTRSFYSKEDYEKIWAWQGSRGRLRTFLQLSRLWIFIAETNFSPEAPSHLGWRKQLKSVLSQVKSCDNTTNDCDNTHKKHNLPPQSAYLDNEELSFLNRVECFSIIAKSAWAFTFLFKSSHSELLFSSLFAVMEINLVNVSSL